MTHIYSPPTDDQLLQSHCNTQSKRDTLIYVHNDAKPCCRMVDHRPLQILKRDIMACKRVLVSDLLFTSESQASYGNTWMDHISLTLLSFNLAFAQWWATCTQLPGHFRQTPAKYFWRMQIFPSKHVALFAVVTFEAGSLLCGIAPNMKVPQEQLWLYHLWTQFTSLLCRYWSLVERLVALGGQVFLTPAFKCSRRWRSPALNRRSFIYHLNNV